ncbi:YdeI/OmpD-associated family protein [Nonlabens marinus]|uniref:DUF1905 domain-containing protein n=1 Tax=Nonlabens marinus S1-08 TaxID=1454201 RepID=W8VW73_9FLAO|nr:YdeI/OmpD-associated family protein [Nonlabens marinus]BAO56078.1 hypothetical protein NMS_2069 [Nonlabens marinus S1-08]
MTFTFTTPLNTDGWIGALIIPEDIAEQLDIYKIKRVVANVSANENELTLYAGVIKRKGLRYLMFSKANKKLLAIEEGDNVHIDMQEDTSKYQAPMTEELEAVLLSDYEAYQIFESLLPGKQRNLIFLIYGIKDSQKRVDVALNAMENLKLGNLNPNKFDKILPF